MDLRETGWENVEWIQLAQDWNRWQAVVNTVMNLRVNWILYWRTFYVATFKYRTTSWRRNYGFETVEG
jgi:hypothetical protein